MLNMACVLPLDCVPTQSLAERVVARYYYTTIGKIAPIVLVQLHLAAGNFYHIKRKEYL
jgi:fumarate reductase subunit D